MQNGPKTGVSVNQFSKYRRKCYHVFKQKLFHEIGKYLKIRKELHNFCGQTIAKSWTSVTFGHFCTGVMDLSYDFIFVSKTIIEELR